MTVRPTWRQPSIVIIWSILTGLCVAASILLPGGDSSFGVLLVLWLFGWIHVRAIRLEVTETEVLVKRGRLWLTKTRQVTRSQIRAIHYYPDVVSFRGPSGSPLMRTRAEWSLKQMIAVAVELQVPVYDNRQCLNLLRTRVGQLVYKPSEG